MKILLQGYYGFGNLGDDVLMKVTYALIKKVFPDAQISVFSNETTGFHLYIRKLLEEDVRLINYSAREEFDFIIHGGGGVHYDFNSGRSQFIVLNSFIKLMGIRNYIRAYKYFKKIRGKENISTNFRIGIGIGVGSFTRSSEKFYNNITLLGDYKYLLVRDSQSVKKTKAFNKDAFIKESTDLAFARSAWTSIQYSDEAPSTVKIGIVLRAWKHDYAHIETVKKIAKKWCASGFEVSFFFFEKEHDKMLINSLGDQNLVVWDPQEQSFDDFFSIFSKQTLVITTRFHGSVLASAFGIPSICLAIEPKLQTIQEMLPSVKILNFPFEEGELLNLVNEVLASQTQLRKKIRNEFEKNSDRVQLDLRDVEFALKNYAKP
jgi:polysaccharide pyruvyl transferase WcaK-like protein